MTFILVMVMVMRTSSTHSNKMAWCLLLLAAATCSSCYSDGINIHILNHHNNHNNNNKRMMMMVVEAAHEQHAPAINCKETERMALLEFFNLTGIISILQWENISMYSNCCQWDGVLCNKHGLVIRLSVFPPTLKDLELDIQNRLLPANWPLPLAKLRSLQALELFGLCSETPLPQEIGLLSQALTDLEVNRCRFLPPLPLQALTNLSKLTTLSLSGPSFRASSLYHIPQEVCNLTSLQRLDLSFNALLGRIPSCLDHLLSLDLSANHLDGPFPQQSWNATSNLNLLALSYNSLTGPIERVILPERLEVLNLSGNRFMGNIPVSVGNLTHAIFLDLSNNMLSGTIPHELGRLAAATIFATGGDGAVVFLSNNNLTGDLPWSLLSNPAIYALDVSYNQITGMIVVDDHRTNFTRVGHSSQRDLLLELSSNHLTGPIVSLLLCRLHGRPFGLSLSYNDLEASPMPTIFGTFDCNPTLTGLDLSFNNMKGPIPSWLSRLTLLTYLVLSQNQLEGSIPSSLSNLTSLTQLDLSFNQLEGNIPSSLSKLTNLTYLRLSTNHLGGPIPSTLSNLTQLQILDLSTNLLEGTIPHWFKFSSNQIQYIDLSANHLRGDLSLDMLCAIPQGIIFFNASHNLLNSLSGNCPEATNYGTWQVLDLSGNQLTGGIPNSIGNMALGSLYLSFNSLSGRIPSSLCLAPGSARFLSALKLENNYLNDSIPDELGYCQALTSLVLRNNLLEGPIPHALSNLSINLQVLDVSKNLLEGSIPPWIVERFQSLRVLILSHNNFFGPLPSSIWNNTQLQVMDISFNNLRGVIPGQSLSLLLKGFLYDSIRKIQNDSTTILYKDSISIEAKGQNLTFEYLLKATVSLDLSHNALSGSIPPELGSLNGLIFLNLSNNHLTGVIPESFGELRQLSSLDLSYNELEGEIPGKQLCFLTFLSVVDVSNNNLRGPIPQCTQWSTFTSESSFLHNKALCGPPLKAVCPNKDTSTVRRNSTSNQEHTAPTIGADYRFLAGIFVGFCVAFPTIFVIIMFWEPAHYLICKASTWFLNYI